MQDSTFFHCVSCLSTISSCICAMMKEKCLNKNNPNATFLIAFGLFHIYRNSQNPVPQNLLLGSGDHVPSAAGGEVHLEHIILAHRLDAALVVGGIPVGIDAVGENLGLMPAG